MSWLWDSKSQNTIHWTHYSISSYAKYMNSGAPAFTMFLNVPHSWVQGTIQSWLRTHRDDQSYNTLRLLDHLTILSSGLDKLANSMMVPETLSLQFVSDHNMGFHCCNQRLNASRREIGVSKITWNVPSFRSAILFWKIEDSLMTWTDGGLTWKVWKRFFTTFETSSPI